MSQLSIGRRERQGYRVNAILEENKGFHAEHGTNDAGELRLSMRILSEF